MPITLNIGESTEESAINRIRKLHDAVLGPENNQATVPSSSRNKNKNQSFSDLKNSWLATITMYPLRFTWIHLSIFITTGLSEFSEYACMSLIMY